MLFNSSTFYQLSKTIASLFVKNIYSIQYCHFLPVMAIALLFVKSMYSFQYCHFSTIFTDYSPTFREKHIFLLILPLFTNFQRLYLYVSCKPYILFNTVIFYQLSNTIALLFVKSMYSFQYCHFLPIFKGYSLALREKNYSFQYTHILPTFKDYSRTFREKHIFFSILPLFNNFQTL